MVIACINDKGDGFFRAVCIVQVELISQDLSPICEDIKTEWLG